VECGAAIGIAVDATNNEGLLSVERLVDGSRSNDVVHRSCNAHQGSQCNGIATALRRCVATQQRRAVAVQRSLER